MTNIIVPFLQAKQIRLLENKTISQTEHCIRHIIWLHIHGKFEEGLLNTSSVISKTSFEQRGMLHPGYHLFGTKKTV